MTGVSTLAGPVAADAVVWNGDALVLERLLGRPTQPERERSLSGFALMLGLRGRTPGLAHHAITFPADYDAEFDDVFVAPPARPRSRRVYVSASCATDAARGAGRRRELVRARQRARRARAESEADADERRLVSALGVGDRIVVRRRRTPADLELRDRRRRRGDLRRRAARAARHAAATRPRVAGVRGLYRVGGTAHPGGGLPLVALGAATVAREIGPAR